MLQQTEAPFFLNAHNPAQPRGLAQTLPDRLATAMPQKPQGGFEYQSETGHSPKRHSLGAGESLGDRRQALMDWQQAKAQGSPREAELLAELERIESYYPANPTKKPH